MALLITLLSLSCWAFISHAQLYGANNCGNGNNNYCGTTDYSSLCTTAANQAAYDAFSGYLGGLGNSTNNYAQSMAFTTGSGNADGTIPPFQFNWYGSSSLIPIAGTYSGSNALSDFFGLVNSDVQNFYFNPYFYPPGQGVIVIAYNCQFLVAQWQEMSSVISTGKAITYATNTVKYTFLNSTYPSIAVADVFVNDAQYQNAFCPGQVNCDGYSSDDDSSTMGISVGTLILVIIIMVFQVVIFAVLFWKLSAITVKRSAENQQVEITDNPMKN
jgi:hypothetical protein